MKGYKTEKMAARNISIIEGYRMLKLTMCCTCMQYKLLSVTLKWKLSLKLIRYLCYMPTVWLKKKKKKKKNLIKGIFEIISITIITNYVSSQPGFSLSWAHNIPLSLASKSVHIRHS